MGRKKARGRRPVRDRSGTGATGEAGTGGTGENAGNSSIGTGADGTGATGGGTGEETSDGVGVVSMNSVQIDAEQLAREADAALAAAPVDATIAAPGGEAAQLPSEWKPVVASMLPMMRLGLVPQWDITDAEANEFCEALARCMDQVMPGGLAGPYACWFRLVASCGGICAIRYMQHGKLPPLGPRRAVQPKEKPGTGPGADPAH